MLPPPLLFSCRLFATFLFLAASALPLPAGSPSPKPQPQPQKIVRVSQLWELRQAVNEAKPGTLIEIAPGDYDGGFFAANAIAIDDGKDWEGAPQGKGSGGRD